ncbi:MAG: type II toxin-antitoxin system HipA family toxin [Sedimenticola sp.]
MVRRRPKYLDVLMNGLKVGELTHASDGALSFRYDSAWLKPDAARPLSRSMPLGTKTYHTEAYNYFDNLLPDNPRIRERIQGRFDAVTSHPYDLLAAIGHDCVGAVQLVHPDCPIQDVRNITATPVDDSQIARILRNYHTAPLGMTGDEDDDFRISLAGAQEKTALLWHDEQWQRPTGTTPTTHIFKLPIGMIEEQQMDLSDSCENEWLCLKIAEAFRFDFCHSTVLHFEGVKALVVERFDRRHSDGWIMRLPQEDMCQALGVAPGKKYERDKGPGIVSIMNLLDNSAERKRDRADFFRSQVLFWLLAAIDGHAKNFSIFIQPYGRYQLTPLYDIMSAHPLIATRQLEAKKANMAMALIGKNRHYHWHSLQARHFISTADRANFSQKEAQLLLSEMMDRVDEVIDLVTPKIPSEFPDHVVTPILEGMRAVRDRAGS